MPYHFQSSFSMNLLLVWYVYTFSALLYINWGNIFNYTQILN